MTVACPGYIPPDLIRFPQVNYEWDDWDPYAPLGEQSEETMSQLAQLSDRAKIAYSIACAEWVVWRLSERVDNKIPYLFLEACWAFEMDKGYVAPKPLEEKEWQGPVYGAIDLALVTVLNTYYATENGEAEVESALGELLALHVLPDSQAFYAWRSRIFERLVRCYRRLSDDVWGEPVPREALDPAIHLDSTQKGKMVTGFLRRLDPKENPFLNYTGGDNSQ